MSRKPLFFSITALLLFGLVLWGNLREERSVVLSETQVLAADQFWYDGFELTMHAEIKVSAHLLDGPAVDLFVVDKENYQALQAAMAGTLPFKLLEFEYFNRVSRPDLMDEYESGWESFTPGTYYIIVDHSVFGMAAPPLGDVDDRVGFMVNVETRR